ncbi:MAG: DUF3795 domain-containing protein [Planctomycetes bacterium]|nr:DUF3795 domain-containing protein [Planctomycetota bacterium]
MDKPLKMGACGITCGECNLYKVSVTHELKAAEACVEWFKSAGWIEADGDAEAVLRAVRNKSPFCDGCWGMANFRGCGEIDFRECCKQKGINHCGECGDFPCGPYTKWVDWHEGHKKAMDHLLSLRNTGVMNHAPHP